MMGLYPQMERKNYDITLEAPDKDSEERLENLRKAIHYGWMAKTRKKVISLGVDEKRDGELYSINILNRTPPKIGGYVNSLLWFGWGVVSYDEDSLYVSPIETGPGDKKYTFKGRENNEFNLPSIRKTPKININMDEFNSTNLKDERRIIEISEILSKNWPNNSLEKIKTIKCSINESTYIIEIETENTNYGDIPLVPLGRHSDVLLYNGWGISAIKTYSLFVSKINEASKSTSKKRFVFEGDENIEEFTYTPRPCEMCGKKEGVMNKKVRDEDDIFSDDSLIVRPELCMDCDRVLPPMMG